MKSLSIRKSSGIAAVEFLITLPLLLLIFSGIVEFGNAFLRYNTLSKAVQNGVRISVVDVYGSSNSAEVSDDTLIKNVVVYGNKEGTGTKILATLSVDDVTVTRETATDSNGNSYIQYVTVTAVYSYDPLLNYLTDVLTGMKLRSSAIMRVAP
ncbi:pilus assembly protein [Vibrio fluvialis]|jgi:Flp pilus assembly protein TadG|uniref:TadE/TadG family type IV pilus assembly protein n=1 Tax=Vibrio fluvialis TaxID=676 RepID=UPI001559B9FF|nr:TadE/TadG family type IV pilus assembly protein [Vibrio fluvialis]EKO3454805.1 pilus assembly protein [Vibrio fluvialis]ELM6621179.1 pilus assembly protein [Vibrio fluvialis]ELO1774157.1 pilus assembly protein [Vibrio fluvialis]ELV8728323.1 pilus assembly protein [Vibrio fluvialis]MBY7769005.1 pilus assembly protein [Vibrio fluvialis]